MLPDSVSGERRWLLRLKMFFFFFFLKQGDLRQQWDDDDTRPLNMNPGNLIMTCVESERPSSLCLGCVMR